MQRVIMIAAILLAGVSSPSWAKPQVFESLYSFPASGEEGEKPTASLSVGPDGKIYGTTFQGGAFDGGTVFRVSTDGAVEIFSHFNPATTGLNPISPLLNVGDGYLYGVTNRNFVPNANKSGTVYRLDPSAPPTTNPERGLTPLFQVPGSGTTTPMRARALTMVEPNVLHVVCQDYAGIWRVPLDGTTAPTVSYFFRAGSIDGFFPNSITRGWDGFLYGTTMGSGHAAAGVNVRGTIFRIAPDGTGMTRLHECEIETGTQPWNGMIQGPDGNFYGTMSYGGTNGSAGCLYRITPDGEYTVLYNFKDLREPRSDLILATDGYLYGTANLGGTAGYGGVYRIRLNGTGYKMIHSFTGPNGGYPQGGLVQGPNGNLYGTTWTGGDGGVGTIFRLNVNLPELAENRPPVALNDQVSSGGGPVLIDVRGNDFDPDGDPLLVSIKALPAHGSIVMQPGGLLQYTPNGTYTDTDAFTYTVIDGRGGEATATVTIRNIPLGPLVQAGGYTGLLCFDPNLAFTSERPRGQFSLKVSSSGKFTGTLITQRKRLNLRGKFDDNGKAVVNVKLPVGGASTLFLAFQRGEPNSIQGALYSAELWTAQGFQVRNSGEPKKATYTVLLNADSSLADGYGYGTMSIQPNGQISVKGKLGDGTTLSWSTSLTTSPDGMAAIPVFSEPIPGGTCGGYLLTDSNGEPNLAPISSFSGEVRWARPAARKPTQPYAMGFEGSVELIATPFTPPAANAPILALPSAPLVLSGGALAEELSGTVTFDGKKVGVTSPIRTLSFNRANGLFTGKVQFGKKTISIGGAVTQGRDFGVGNFVLDGITGQVRFNFTLRD